MFTDVSCCYLPAKSVLQFSSLHCLKASVAFIAFIAFKSQYLTISQKMIGIPYLAFFLASAGIRRARRATQLLAPPLASIVTRRNFWIYMALS